jgi:hypothetical protein
MQHEHVHETGCSWGSKNQQKLLKCFGGVGSPGDRLETVGANDAVTSSEVQSFFGDLPKKNALSIQLDSFEKVC